jgi:mannose-6-phosphate isomerase-like protein (cupin superfamily)
MAGKLCRVNVDSPWITEIPNHEGYRLTPMINPKLCPGAQIEFYVGEFQPGIGRAIDHTHEREDNVFYVLSGRATAKVGDSEYSLEPGDALWVPKGEVHNFDVIGGETFRLIAIFSPPRAM